MSDNDFRTDGDGVAADADGVSVGERVSGGFSGAPDLSVLLITLLKGVLYRDGDERLWATLMHLQVRVRDYVGVLNLDLVLDEAEGYAFLRGRPEPAPDDPSPRLPRLVARRPLSFPVSLLLALLRRKLLEFDADGGGTRLVMDRDELVDLLRVFMPEGSNEVRLIDQMDATISKVVDLGFLRRLKPAAGAARGAGSFEVRRILKAFVDAQWLSEFDARLLAYQAQLAGDGGDDAQGTVDTDVDTGTRAGTAVRPGVGGQDVRAPVGDASGVTS